jgi:hypothetical protein
LFVGELILPLRVSFEAVPRGVDAIFGCVGGEIVLKG